MPDPKNEEEGKRFRFQKKLIFLTYSQCGRYKVTRELVRDRLLKYGAPLKYYIAQENHADKQGIHIHALWWYKAKPDFKNCRQLDVNGCHPNWGNVIGQRGGFKGLVRYLRDDCDTGKKKKSRADGGIDSTPLTYHLDEIEPLDMDDYTHAQYPKAKAGYLLKLHDQAKANEPLPTFPITFHGGGHNQEYQLVDPDKGGKNRSWWIMAPSGWGKSEWIQDTLGDKLVFFAGADKETRWEGYEKEKIVIFDDIIPTWADMSQMLQKCRFVGQPVPGKTRYNRVFRQKGCNLSFIVLSNKTIEQAYDVCPDLWPQIKQRFTEIICDPSISYMHMREMKEVEAEEKKRQEKEMEQVYIDMNDKQGAYDHHHGPDGACECHPHNSVVRYNSL